MKLRPKFIIVFILSSLLPVVAILFANALETQKTLGAARTSGLYSLAARANDSLQHFVSLKQQRVTDLSHDPFYATASGPSLNARLGAALVLDSDFLSITLIQGDGHVLGSTNAAVTGKRLSTDLIPKGLTLTRVALQRPELDRVGALQLVTSATLPVTGGEQRVLVGTYSTESISHTLDIEPFTDARVAISDPASKTVIASNVDYYRSVPDSLSAEVFSACDTSTAREGHWADAAATSLQGVTQCTYVGKDPVVLSAETREDNLFIGNRNFTLSFAISVIAVVCASLFFLLVFRRLILRPLSALNRLVYSYAKGDYMPKGLPGSSLIKDELGILYNVLLAMGKNFQELNQNLEQKVQQQTADLQARVKEVEKAKQATLHLVDDLKRSNSQIAREKSQTEAVLSGIGEGVVALDKRGKIIVFNDSIKKMLGLASINQNAHFGELVYLSASEDGKNISETLLNTALEGSKYENIPQLFLKVGDRIIPVAFNISPIVNDGEVLGVVIAIRDITEQNAVDRAKTEFVSLASHQLRTPLSSIRWNSEMLLDYKDKLDPELLPIIEAIHSSNLNMIDLVNDLLNVSRIELGKLSITEEPADIREAIKEVMTTLKPDIKESKQTINLSIDDDIPKIKLGKKWQTIIVENLLTNAHKYTPSKGEISVSLTYNRTENTVVAGKKFKKDSLVLAVSDTGYGIPENLQKNIFKKLYRADNITNLDVSGTGLGLYLCHEIVHQSGGVITFSSTEGKGTTFYIVYPSSRLAR